MPRKKKARKKPAAKKSNRKARRMKASPARKAPAKKSRKKAAARKASPKARVTPRKIAGKTRATSKAREREQRQAVSAEYPTPIVRRSGEGEWSGDLQGLSNSAQADSESVDELLEEGNSREAGVVSGVERAGNQDEREVHTEELPEDDVPEEYLNED